MTLPVTDARPTQGSRAAQHAIRRAADLICAVRDEGACGIARHLDDLTTEQHYALTVTLAAMVPDDRPVEQLLAWTKEYA